MTEMKRGDFKKLVVRFKCLAWKLQKSCARMTSQQGKGPIPQKKRAGRLVWQPDSGTHRIWIFCQSIVSPQIEKININYH